MIKEFVRTLAGEGHGREANMPCRQSLSEFIERRAKGREEGKRDIERETERKREREGRRERGKILLASSEEHQEKSRSRRDLSLKGIFAPSQ